MADARDSGATWTASYEWDGYPPDDVIRACGAHDAPPPSGRVWVFMVSPEGAETWMVCTRQDFALVDVLDLNEHEPGEEQWVAKVGHADPSWLDSLSDFGGW